MHPPWGMTGGMKQGFQRISQSLVEMALITGVCARVIHVVSNAHGKELDWHSFVGTLIVAPILVLTLAAVHLANYPVRQWLWRAPLFSLLETAVEVAVSFALITAGRERWGTGRAVMHDWPAMAEGTLLWRFTTICLFALILGAIAQWVRRRELTADWQQHHLHNFQTRNQQCTTKDS